MVAFHCCELYVWGPAVTHSCLRNPLETQIHPFIQSTQKPQTAGRALAQPSKAYGGLDTHNTHHHTINCRVLSSKLDGNKSSSSVQCLGDAIT